VESSPLILSNILGADSRPIQPCK